MMQPEEIVLREYSLKEAKRVLRLLKPDAILETQYPCIRGFREVLRKNHISVQQAREWIIRMQGEAAQIVFCAVSDGWWPKANARKVICTAPGDRAWAVRRAVEDGWWDPDDAREVIRTAPGNRAVAVYWAVEDGWWDPDDAWKVIRAAPAA